MAKKKFYVVVKGFKPGIYDTWDEAKKNVDGFRGNKHKAFPSRAEAETYFKQEIASGKHTNPHSSISSVRSSGHITKDNNVKKKTSLKSFELALTDDGADAIIKSCPDTPKQRTIDVYTDGSTLGNGQRGARAGYGVYYGINDPRNVSKRLPGTPQTNQRAELSAVNEALEQILKDLPDRARIYTDSQYTIKCLTVWGVNWEKKGYKTANGGPVQNEDLIRLGIHLFEKLRAKGVDIQFYYVPGHKGHHGNEEADRLARYGASLDS